MAEDNIKARASSSSTSEDDDSGLVADAFDVLPDENTLAIEDDVFKDLTYNEFDSFDDECLEELSDLVSDTPISMEEFSKDFNEIDHIEEDCVFKTEGQDNVTTRNGHCEHPGKLVAFNREQARQWRRKRLINSGQKSTNIIHQDKKLIPLLPLPKTLKPIKDHTRKLNGDLDISVKKLQDPLLGGEKIRSNRGPMPMKLRALPESFWKEPTTIKNSSLARSNYNVLPPLFSSENHVSDEVMNIRPVTPPDEKGKSPGHSPRHKKKWVVRGEADPDLLFSLFDHLEDKKVDERLLVRRGRPKKIANEKTPPPPPRDANDDPCIVDNLAEKLFPELSLSQRTKEKINGSSYAIIKVGKGKSTVEFPAIQADQNYPAMLDELVTHM